MQQNKNVKTEFRLLKKKKRNQPKALAGGKSSRWDGSKYCSSADTDSQEIQPFCHHHTHSKQQHLSFPVVVLNISTIIRILSPFHNTRELCELHWCETV